MSEGVATPGNVSLCGLKDRTLSWAARLSTAAQLWRSDTYVPKKEQLLTDWLTFSIHAGSSKSEPLPPVERQGAWSLLHNILTSQLIKDKTVTEEGIVIPVWFYKDILAAVSESEDVSQMLGCLRIISCEQRFKTFTYLSLDSLVDLLSGCCRACAAAQSADLHTLSSIITNLITRIRQMTDKRAVAASFMALLANKLFVPGIAACLILGGGDPTADLLLKVMLRLMVHRDSLKHYERFLRERTGDSKTVQKGAVPKASQKRDNFVEVVFSSLIDGLKSSKDETRRMYLRVTTALFEQYLSSCTESSIKMDRFGMLRHLLHLATEIALPEETVQLWSRLLSLCGRFEIHSPASEVAATEYAAFSKTVTALLTTYKSCTTADWFECLTLLADINHKCVEKQLSNVLFTSWQQAQELDGAAADAQTALLCELLSVYHKLRQLPKIVNAIVESVLASKRPTPLPAKVIVSLGSLMASSPPSLCYNLWLDMYTPALELALKAEDQLSYTRCLAYTEIVCTIMYHVKIYDTSVPLSVRNKLTKQMGKLDTDLSGAVQSCRENPDMATHRAPMILMLVDAHNAMTFMVHCYISQPLDVSPTRALQPAIDLAQHLLSIAQRKTGDGWLCQLHFLCLRLYSHKLSQLQQLSSAAISTSDELSVCVSGPLQLWSDLDLGPDNFQEWENTILSLDEGNIGSAILGHISTSAVSAYIALAGPELIRSFTVLVLNAGWHSARRDSPGLTTSAVFDSFLDGWVFAGLAPVHEFVFEEMVSRLASAFTVPPEDVGTPPAKKKKRRRSEAVVECGSAVSEFFTCFLECMKDKSLATSEGTSPIKRLYKQTCELVMSALPLPNAHQRATFQFYTRVVRSLPATTLNRSLLLPALSLVIIKLASVADTPQVDKGLLSQVDKGLLSQVDKGLLLQTHLMLFLQAVNQRAPDLRNLINVENTIDLFRQLPDNLLISHKQEMLAPLVKIVISGDGVFDDYVAYMDKTFADFLSALSTANSLSVSQNLSTGLLLRVVKVSLQPSSMARVNSSVVSWVVKSTNSLLTSLQSSSQRAVLSSELLTWLSVALASQRKLELTDMKPLTNLVMRDLELIATDEGERDDANIDSLLSYLTNSLTSTSTHATSNHLSADVACAAWRHVALMAGKMGSTSTISKTVFALITSMKKQTLSQCLQMFPHMLNTASRSNLSSVVSMWQILTSLTDVAKPKQHIIDEHCQQFVVRSQSCICELSAALRRPASAAERDSIKQVLLHLLTLLADVIDKGRACCDVQAVTSVLTSLELIDCETDAYDAGELIKPLSAVQRLLRSVLLHHQLIAGYNMHIYTAISTKLVDWVVRFGDQDRLLLADESAVSTTESELLSCCQELHKVFSTMSGYPMIFSKVSAFLMGDLIHSMTSITLLPNVKKALYLAFNGVFDLMDDHSVMMLKTNLQESGREVFKTLLGQYEKYHKYSGRV